MLQSSSMEYAVIKVVGDHGGSRCGLHHAHWRLWTHVYPYAVGRDIGPLDSPVDMYVDDTFGVGRSDHVRVAQDRVVLVSEGVLAPGTAISTEKVSLLLVQTSSDITSIVWQSQSVPRIGRSISSSVFYSVSVIPIDNHLCYGSVSLRW